MKNILTFDKVDEFVDLSSTITEETTNDYLEQLQESYLGPHERRNYYRFLYQIVMYTQPKFALEIGIEHAIGSAYMCVASSTYGGKVVGIDIKGCGRDVYHNYTFLQLDSQLAEDKFKEIVNVGELGVVFQDSSHHYNASCNEWNIYSKYLSDNAIWVCDDITPSFYNTDVDPPGKGMERYFADLPGDKKLYTDVLHYGNTMGVVLL